MPCSNAWYSSPERRFSFGVGGVPSLGAASRSPGRTFASLRHPSWGCKVRSSKLWACTSSTREIGQSGFCLAPDLGTPAQSSCPPSGLAAFLASVQVLGVQGVPLQASGTHRGGGRSVALSSGLVLVQPERSAKLDFAFLKCLVLQPRAAVFLQAWRHSRPRWGCSWSRAYLCKFPAPVVL